MILLSFPRCLALVVFCGFLGGCATRPIEPGARARMKNVGVLSVMTDDVDFQRIGTTVFGNARKSVPIDTFGLQQTAEQSVAAALEGRRAVVLDGERARVAKTVNLTRMQRWVRGGTLDKEAIGAEARRLGSAHGIDSLLVLVPGALNMSYPDRTLEGFVLEQRSFFGHESTTALAVQELRAYDTRTGTLIGTARAIGIGQLSNAAWKNAEPVEIRACLGKLIHTNSETMLAGLGLRAPAAPAR